MMNEISKIKNDGGKAEFGTVFDASVYL